jgi:hypothetical protein
MLHLRDKICVHTLTQLRFDFYLKTYMYLINTRHFKSVSLTTAQQRNYKK